MSGNRLFFDTNAIIYLLKGEPRFSNINIENSRVFISVISIIEFLSYPNLTESEKWQFDKFCQEVEVIGFDYYTDNSLIEKTIEIKQKYRMKLPDAIIAASAQISQSSIITADKELLKVSEIKIIPI